MATRRCLGCRTLITTGSRCPTCDTHAQRYNHTWRTHARSAINTHIGSQGHHCPGWRVPAHPSTDLTLDHDGVVLCRACNSRKRNLGDG